MAHDERLELPIQVISRVDVGRLIRELELLEDYMTQASIRKAEGGSVLPRTSQLLEDLAATNHLNFLQIADQQKAREFLKAIFDSAPLFHISFASNPSAAFTRKILAWFRNNIHTYSLINIGLEPGIAAGCILRTANRQFDLSLRQHFLDNQQTLRQMLTGQAG